MSFPAAGRLQSCMAVPRPQALVCDVGAVVPDATAIDALARPQLHARRLGAEIRLRHASQELQQLLEFAGLGEVLRLESSGQVE